MASWSQRRKAFYASIVIIVAVGAIGVPLFLVLYKAPSCFDGAKNGDEQGIDCGGSCQKLCQSAFFPASVSWTRFEQLVPGQYNVAAYIINQNTSAAAVNVPYHIVLYDNRGVAITDSSGTVNIPPHRNVLAFQSGIKTGQRVPTRALFEFTAPPQWFVKADPLPDLSIGNKDYSEDGSGSSLMVTLANSGAYAIYSLDVYAVLYDKDGNALGFSKTTIDQVPPQGTAQAPFTWPVERQGKVISIEVLPVAE